MTKITQKQKPFNDLAFGNNNGVWAIYVVGRDLLEVENKYDLIGVPFLTWGKPSKESQETKDIQVLYTNHDQFKREIESKLITNGVFPEPTEEFDQGAVLVNGVYRPMRSLARGYVPYSFGCYHFNDQNERVRVRNSEDYCNFVNKVIPEVLQIRKTRAKTLEKDSSRFNRFKTRLGMHKPTEFRQDQPALIQA